MDEYTVLVVEDDETARIQLAKAIKKEGYHVLAAEDGRAGLELFKKERPEIVVTDLKMPGIDGMEVIHTIRGLSKTAQVIVVTAFGETDTAISALREGALDYIKKPLDLDQLSVALGRAKEKITGMKMGGTFPVLLLAEDEEKVRERLARVLEKEGWKVIPAPNGAEAVKTFEEVKIDVALLDIKMPKKDGLQALHEMRGISDDFEAIILTGYGDESSAVQALRDGAINFLKKPIDIEQMILAVQKALAKLNSERSLKYRSRELELARQIIAKITEENQILIDLSRSSSKTTSEFAQQLINAFPVCLLVMDYEMNILFVNKMLERAIENKPGKLNEEMVKRLIKVGIKNLPYAVLRSEMDRIKAAPTGMIRTIPTGKYSYVTLAPVTVLLDGREENTVLAIIRGERS